MAIIRWLAYRLLWRMTDYQMFGVTKSNQTGYVGYYHIRGHRLALMRKDGTLDFGSI